MYDAVKVQYIVGSAFLSSAGADFGWGEKFNWAQKNCIKNY